MERTRFDFASRVRTALFLVVAMAAARSQAAVEWETVFPDSETVISSAYPDGAGGYILTGSRGDAGLIARIDGHGVRGWSRLADSTGTGPVAYLGLSGPDWVFRYRANLIAVDAAGKTVASLAGIGDGDWGPDETYLYAPSGSDGARTIRKIRADGSPVWERVLDDSIPGPARFVNGRRGSWILSPDSTLRRFDQAGTLTADRHIPLLPVDKSTPPIALESASGQLAVCRFSSGILAFARIDTAGELQASASYDLTLYLDGFPRMRQVEEKDGVISVTFSSGRVTVVFPLDAASGALTGAPAYSPSLPALHVPGGVELDAGGRWVYWGSAPDSLARHPTYTQSTGGWLPSDYSIPAMGTAGSDGVWHIRRLEDYRDTVWVLPLPPPNCGCPTEKRPIGAQGFLFTSDGGALLLGNFRKAGAQSPGAVGVLKLAQGFTDAIVPRKRSRKPPHFKGKRERVDAAGRRRIARGAPTFGAPTFAR